MERDGYGDDRGVAATRRSGELREDDLDDQERHRWRDKEDSRPEFIRHRPDENGRGLNGEQRAAKLKEGQDELLGMTKQCTVICDWLSGKAKIKTINKRHTSYGLKHMAEKEIGYITNGAFICAAVFCGFDFNASGANARFNTSEKSLKQ